MYSRQVGRFASRSLAFETVSVILDAMNSKTWSLGLSVLLLGLATINSPGQDRLKTMPGYSRYEKMSAAMTNAVRLGSLSVTWKDGGKVFEYQKDGKRYRYDIATKTAAELKSATSAKTNAAPDQSARA